MVPVYGVSLTLQTWKNTGQIYCNRRFHRHCQFQLSLETDDGLGGWVITDKSKLVHNHSPTHEIMSDPSWRPEVKNVVARRALGMPTSPTEVAKSSTRKSKQTISKAFGLQKSSMESELDDDSVRFLLSSSFRLS